MEYRKDIQILRGIAVLLVVLFHLEIAGFTSGFLGVDVFFVISGYLMAMMYNPAKKVDFFIKRARRLLPAYLATVIAVVGASALISTPNDFMQVSSQAYFATFFASNIGFWLENSYFDKASFKPLLHLWSLGVEIQFYLFVPAIAWAASKSRLSLPLVFILSALACFYVLGISPKTSFFFMPLRLWEFVIGFAVAAHLMARRQTKKDGLSIIGLLSLAAIVGIPLVRIDGTASGFINGHPGLIAAIIALATASALLCGIPKWLETNQVATGLESIGKYSYSIYLAHFPIIVLFLYTPFSGTVLKAPNKIATIELCAIVLVASLLLYFLVENAFRNRAKAFRWFLAYPVAVVAICQLGAFVVNSGISDEERRIFQAWSDRSPYRCGKINRLLNPTAITCEITDSIGNPTNRILLVGNSHADSIKSSFADAAKRRNVSVHFMVENNPLMPGGLGPEAIMNEAQRIGAKAVVLHFSPTALSPGVLKKMGELAKAGLIDLAIVLPVPVWKESVPKMLYKAHHGIEKLPTASIRDYEGLNKDLLDATSRTPDSALRSYSIAEIFCHPDCILTTSAGQPIYFDATHLTLSGAALLTKVFDRLLEDLVSQRTPVPH